MIKLVVNIDGRILISNFYMTTKTYTWLSEQRGDKNVLLPQINESYLVVQALYICLCIPSQLLSMCLSNQSKSAHCLEKDYLRKTSMAWIYLIRISRSRRLPLDSSSWRCVVWFSSPGGSSRVGGASERASPPVRSARRETSTRQVICQGSRSGHLIERFGGHQPAKWKGSSSFSLVRWDSFKFSLIWIFNSEK